jgi:ribonuclease HI
MKRVYTDGSCLGNPGSGGWACGSTLDDIISGSEDSTTNNRMELTGAIRALESFGADIVVVTDSTYVRNGVTKWAQTWVRNGWKTSGGGQVKNRDLWERIMSLITPATSWEWVKAHSGEPMNEAVDSAARAQAQAVKSAR